MKKRDIEIIDAKRDPITHEEMLKLMGWSWGAEGVKLAKIWQGINKKHFGNALTPLPIWFPATLPWGKSIGQFTANTQGESLHIQLKRGMSMQNKADTLFHEMIHQKLSEDGKNSDHNAVPWCEEIMRLTQELWGVSIRASPDSPRKVDGKSQRNQKTSPKGRERISRDAIASFPQSLGLNIEIKNYLSLAVVISFNLSWLLPLTRSSSYLFIS